MSETKKDAEQDRWAPWWVYVIVILGCNFAKQQLISGKVNDIANIAITLALAAGLFFLITAIYRGMKSR